MVQHAYKSTISKVAIDSLLTNKKQVYINEGMDERNSSSDSEQYIKEVNLQRFHSLLKKKVLLKSLEDGTLSNISKVDMIQNQEVCKTAEYKPNLYAGTLGTEIEDFVMS